jgi:hypothetical protein
VQRTRGLNHACLQPSRVTCLGHWPGRAGPAGSSPAHVGCAEPSPNNKK